MPIPLHHLGQQNISRLQAVQRRANHRIHLPFAAGKYGKLFRDNCFNCFTSIFPERHPRLLRARLPGRLRRRRTEETSKEKNSFSSKRIKRHFFRRIPCTVATGNAAAWRSAAKGNALTAVGSAPLLAPASPTTTSARGTAGRGGSGAGRRHAGETQGSCARDCSCFTWCR